MGIIPINDLLVEAKAKGWKTVLILTALDLELQAVLAHITDVSSVMGRTGTIYECGFFREAGQEWLVVLVETGAGNHEAHNAVTNAHMVLEPDLQFFVGVAGSRKKDVPIGSVVAASIVYSPYAGKYDENGFSARPREYPANSRLLEVARKVRRDKKWTERITDLYDRKLPSLSNYPCAFPPLAEVAPAVSTESVLANKSSDLEALIAKDYGDACIVEMEGYGSLFAAAREETPAIVIRGVSDMAEHKDPETDKLRQPVAAAHAAAFAFELLAWWIAFHPSAHAHPTPIVDPGPDTPRLRVQPPTATRSSADAPSTHYVLNFDAEVGSVSAQRIAAIEALLRELVGDPGISVERIEKGSLRLIVRDPSAALEAIGSEKLRNEFERRFSLHLFGIVPEHSLEGLKEVTEELRIASHDLLHWPDSLPDGERFERPELQQLLALSSDRDRSVTAVIGDPGSGKSALLAVLGKRLIEAGHPVLAIKADLLDIDVSTEADLQERLGLSERPSSLLKRLSALRPTFLLIDQLDALAGYLDLRTGRLSALLNLVRRLGKADNIHIVLSARKFEYEHDVRLRAIGAESLELQLPGWSAVLELLEAKGIAAAGWPADAQEVLRSPQALAIYLQLDETVRSESLLSYQSVLDCLWDERVLSGSVGIKRAQVAANLANQMAEEESLWLPLAKLDDVKVQIDELIAISILTLNSTGSSVGFAHQTVFDYALARAFAKESGKLSSFAIERQASIFCRPKVWAALTYLRAADPKSYEEEIGLLWNANGLRRHLRLLLIEFLGQQRSPSNGEETLILSAFALDRDRALAFRGITGSPGWFARLKRSTIARAMTEEEPYRDLVVPVLAAAIDFSPEEVTNLIERQWLSLPENDYRSWSVLQQAPVWSDAMLEAGITVLSRSKVASIYVDHIVGSLGAEQPRVALLLVRAALDRLLSVARSEGTKLAADKLASGTDPTELNDWGLDNGPARVIKNLLETANEWDMLRALGERAPSDTIEILWPWFVNALEALANLRPEPRDRPLYALQYVADFRFEGENGIDLPEPSIPSALRIAIEQLAANDIDQLRAWASAASRLDFQPVHRLIAHAFRSNPSEFADDAFNYILADERRWSLGHIQDYSATTTGLISNVAPFWSPEQVAIYEQRVKNYGRSLPSDLQNPDGRKTWSRILRTQRLRMLRSLPTNRRTPETAELVRTEERAIGDGHLGVKFSGVYSPASIMSATDMGRAKNEDIVNAFHELPDATRWDHPSDYRKGGNIQLSREFANFAKVNPDRAIHVISHFEPAFGERGAGAAIAEMAETIDPEILQALIVSLAQRGFGTPEFQGSIATSIETLLSRNVQLSSELVETMKGWLLADARSAEGPKEEEMEHDESETSSQDEDPEAKSLLWGYGGLSLVPGGPFPILHALVHHFVKHDHEALCTLLYECLPLNFEQDVWANLLPTLRYLQPSKGSDAGPATALIAAILEQFPGLVGTRDLAFLLAHIQWWAPHLVEQELVRWKDSKEEGARQGYGELIALMAFQHSDRGPLKAALTEIQLGDDARARAGAAITAVNLWANPTHRPSTTAFLVGLIPEAGDAEWYAIFDLFRIIDELIPDESTALLLEAIADHAASAPQVSATYIVDRLQSLLPHEAPLVARLAIALVEQWHSDLADIRTGTAAHASDLVDLAVTLHRLGPITRDAGTRLFERLLEIDAFEARATLDQIDSRFRGSIGIRRPRLPRPHRNLRRRRGLS